MPIYEYRCDSCGFQKEYIQRMSDAKLTDCPECKKATFSKMVTAAGFQLKGGGWYVTDFKSGGSNTNATNATNATGGPKKSVDKQSDTYGSAEPAKAESAKSESTKTETGAASSSSAAVSTPAASTASTPASSSGN